MPSFGELAILLTLLLATTTTTLLLNSFTSASATSQPPSTTSWTIEAALDLWSDMFVYSFMQINLLESKLPQLKNNSVEYNISKIDWYHYNLFLKLDEAVKDFIVNYAALKKPDDEAPQTHLNLLFYSETRLPENWHSTINFSSVLYAYELANNRYIYYDEIYKAVVRAARKEAATKKFDGARFGQLKANVRMAMVAFNKTLDLLEVRKSEEILTDEEIHRLSAIIKAAKWTVMALPAFDENGRLIFDHRHHRPVPQDTSDDEIPYVDTFDIEPKIPAASSGSRDASKRVDKKYSPKPRHQKQQFKPTTKRGGLLRLLRHPAFWIPSILIGVAGLGWTAYKFGGGANMDHLKMTGTFTPVDIGISTPSSDSGAWHDWGIAIGVVLIFIGFYFCCKRRDDETATTTTPTSPKGGGSSMIKSIQASTASPGGGGGKISKFQIRPSTNVSFIVKPSKKCSKKDQPKAKANTITKRGNKL